MVTIINAGRVYKGKQYLELAGLSTDDKPVTGLLNGSLFHELDTTKIYAYNEEGDTGEEWIMQVQLTEQEDSRSLSMAASPTVTRPNLQLGQGVPTIDFPEERTEELEEQEEEPEEPTEEPEGDDE